jgi:hypothetical protein
MTERKERKTNQHHGEQRCRELEAESGVAVVVDVGDNLGIRKSLRIVAKSWNRAFEMVFVADALEAAVGSSLIAKRGF